MIPTAKLRLMCAMTNIPKPLGFDVMVDDETIAVLEYDAVKEAMLAWENAKRADKPKTDNIVRARVAPGGASYFDL